MAIRFPTQICRATKALYEHDVINIENLCNLDKCGNDLFWFFALPLKWKNADGAPLRAIAFGYEFRVSLIRLNQESPLTSARGALSY